MGACLALKFPMHIAANLYRNRDFLYMSGHASQTRGRRLFETRGRLTLFSDPPET
jgi:hypothetical protein